MRFQVFNALCMLLYKGNERSGFCYNRSQQYRGEDLQLYLKKDSKIELLVRIPVFLRLNCHINTEHRFTRKYEIVYILRCHVKYDLGQTITKPIETMMDTTDHKSCVLRQRVKKSPNLV